MNRHSFLCLLCLFAAILCGCGDGSNETKSGAATPEEAVAAMYAAMQAGDAAALADVMAPPWDGFLRQNLEGPAKITQAQQEIDAALDAAFGPRDKDSSLAFGSKLADSLLSDLKHSGFSAGEMQGVTAKVIEQREDGKRLLLTIEETMDRDGKEHKRQQEIIASQHGGVWKLAPGDVDAAEPQKRWDDFNKLLDTYAAVTREVQDGKFKARWEVERCLTFALALNAAWLLEVSSPREEFRGDLLALGLLREDLPAELEPGAPPVRVYVRGESIIMEDAPSGIAAAELAARLKQLRAENPGLTIRVVYAPGPDGSSETLKTALGAILDSGDDLPRVGVVFESEQGFEQLEPELTGRLRLFALRTSLPRLEQELKLEEMPEEMIDPSIEPDLEPTLDPTLERELDEAQVAPLSPDDSLSPASPDDGTGDLPPPSPDRS